MRLAAALALALAFAAAAPAAAQTGPGSPECPVLHAYLEGHLAALGPGHGAGGAALYVTREAIRPPVERRPDLNSELAFVLPRDVESRLRLSGALDPGAQNRNYSMTDRGSFVAHAPQSAWDDWAYWNRRLSRFPCALDRFEDLAIGFLDASVAAVETPDGELHAVPVEGGRDGAPRRSDTTVLAVSRIGFSESGEHALIYIRETCTIGCEDDVGAMVLMRQSAGGVWRLHGVAQMWRGGESAEPEVENTPDGDG